MVKKNNNLIFLAVAGIGAFFLLTNKAGAEQTDNSGSGGYSLIPSFSSADTGFRAGEISGTTPQISYNLGAVSFPNIAIPQEDTAPTTKKETAVSGGGYGIGTYGSGYGYNNPYLNLFQGAINANKTGARPPTVLNQNNELVHTPQITSKKETVIMNPYLSPSTPAGLPMAKLPSLIK